MMFSPSVYLFMSLYLISFFLCINMDDWFLMWMGLEINMLSFIFLIYSRGDLINIESCFKYFFIQSLGSAFFIGFFYLNSSIYEYISVLVLSYKMGGGPFFFWFPSMCMGISWFSCFILMSFQKLIPLMLMMSVMSWVVWIIVMVSLVVGVVGSFNQVNMKALMSYSSIHQIGWLLMCMFVSKIVGILYYLMYIVMILVVIFKMSEYEINNYLSIMNLKFKWWFLLMMMSMGGVPPFLGFFLKWVGIYCILSYNLLIVVYMILLSVIMLYVYMRICYGVLMSGGESMNYVNLSVESVFNNGLSMIGDFFIMLALFIGGVFIVSVL